MFLHFFACIEVFKNYLLQVDAHRNVEFAAHISQWDWAPERMTDACLPLCEADRFSSSAIQLLPELRTVRIRTVDTQSGMGKPVSLHHIANRSVKRRRTRVRPCS